MEGGKKHANTLVAVALFLITVNNSCLLAIVSEYSKKNPASTVLLLL